MLRPFTAISTWHKDSSGIHQTTTQSPLTVKHFHDRGTKICVRGRWVTAYFTSASVANRLPVRCLLSGPKKKSLGSTMSTAIVTCHDATDGTLQTTLRTVPISHQVIPAICYKHRYEASRHFLATDTWHQFLLRQDKHQCATVGQMLTCQWWMGGGLMCTVCYPYAIYTAMAE